MLKENMSSSNTCKRETERTWHQQRWSWHCCEHKLW